MNKPKKKVELVCTGNQGRSPVAELRAKKYLIETGLGREYDVLSSGTLVDAIKRAVKQSMKVMSPIVQVAITRGDIYSPSDIPLIDEAIRAGNDEVVRPYFQSAVEVFGREELQFRTEVLPEFGLNPSELKQTTDQTVPGADRLAVLAMDKTNYPKIVSIYSGSGFSPIIGVMSAYATGNPDAEVSNAFGLGRAGYRERAAQIIREVPRAIDAIITATS